MTEAVAISKKSVTSLLRDIKKLTGEALTSRLNFYLPPKTMDIFRNALKTKPPKSIAGMRIQKNITIDGYKFTLDDNTWIGFRLSGTESAIRVYAEAGSETKLSKLLKTGRDFIYGR